MQFHDVDSTNGIIINDIFDHLPVFTFVKYSKFKINYNNKLPTYRNVRLLKESNIEMISNRLSNLEWFEVTNCNDVNKADSRPPC